MKIDKNRVVPHAPSQKIKLGRLKASGSVDVPLVPDVPQFFPYSASKTAYTSISIF
ncbi:TPA: hypothetical protein ACXHA5_000641 [Legionella pneumophila]|nr:hypothetical protein [Legionella pneumophila]